MKFKLTPIFLLTIILPFLTANTVMAQGALTNGYTHQAAISPVGNVDAWTFAATIGDRIVIRVGKISQTNSFTPRLSLLNPSAVQLATDNGTWEAEIAVTATNTGTFTVNVDDVGSDATGTYRLTLAKSPGAITVAPGDEGGAMTNGWKHTGVIDIGDLDEWSFTANSGDSLVVRMGSTVALYPYVRLYGPDGRLLSADSAAYEGEAAFRATNSGTFTVVASSFYNSGYAGSYILTLAKSPGAITVAPGDEGGTLTNGWTHTGVIDIGDLDEWSFTANSGDSLVVRMGSTVALYPYVRLYGPDGRLLSADSAAYEGEAAFRATNSGTFTVVASSFYNSGYSGSYILTLAKSPGAITVAPGDEGGSMTNGWTHTGVINSGDLDEWSFTANSGDSLVVRMGSTVPLYPYVRLYGPDGRLLSADFEPYEGEAAFRATNSGTFTVVASSFYNSGYSGSYILTLAKSPGTITVAPGDEGGPLTNGWTHAGVINIGDLDEWSFTANTGDSLVVRMGSTNNFYPYVRLYGPDGRLLSANFDNYEGEAAFRATNSGTFTVVASSYYNSGYSGSYILTLAKSPGAITVAPGDEGGEMTNGFVHLGTIATGDLDVFTFLACIGDGIVLQVTEITDAGGFTPAMRLYAPDGTLLKTVSGATSAQIITNAPFLGSYTLVVGDNAAGAGTYQLTGLGVSTGFILCKPLINGTNLVVRSVGGPAGSNYVLFTATNIALPLTNWTPIRTNQFGLYGEFSVTNVFSKSVTQQYFRVRTP